MFKTVEFGDFAAWWALRTLLQLSLSFPFGKSPKILIFSSSSEHSTMPGIGVPRSRERNAAGWRNPTDGICKSDAERVAKYHT